MMHREKNPNRILAKKRKALKLFSLCFFILDYVILIADIEFLKIEKS